MESGERDASREAEDDGQPQVQEMRWVSHPLRSSPQKTGLLVMVIVSTAALVYVITSSVGWLVASVVILSVGVHDYLFPVEFGLTQRGIERRMLFYTRRKEWASLSSYYPDRNGVFLSPFKRPSRLENYRGIYVRFGDNRDQVLSFVKERMGERGENERTNG